MIRALVTGAAGFMGSHVVDECLRQGMEVVAVDNLSGGYRSNVAEKAEFVQMDLWDPGEAEGLFEEHGPFDYVYHLGAYAAEGLSHFIRRYNYETNLIASVELINQSVLHKVKRFIFTSSIAVYGHGTDTALFSENQFVVPADPYGISKYAVELDLKAAKDQFGLNYTIFRPHNVYGPRQNICDPYRNVVGIFMRQAILGEPMTIFGDGSQKRQFTYITDVAGPIVQCTHNPRTNNETYNVGSSQVNSSCTVLDLAHIVAEEFEVDCVVKFLPVRNEVVNALANHKKFSETFKIEHVSIKRGVKLMKQWLDTTGIPTPNYFTGNIEVPNNMPPSWLNAVKVPNTN